MASNFETFHFTTRSFQSPAAARLCPGLGLAPASSATHSPPAAASLTAPGSRPSRRIPPSRRRSYASTLPLPAPHPPLYDPPIDASALRSSALPCADSSIYTPPLFFSAAGSAVGRAGLFGKSWKLL
jgi:hypothetical protein